MSAYRSPRWHRFVYAGLALGAGLFLYFLLTNLTDRITGAEDQLADANAASSSLIEQLDLECSTVPLSRRTPQQDRICDAAEKAAETIAPERGADGLDGRDGLPGASGSDGSNGADGRDGRDGKDGKDGARGPAGIDGKDGAAGQPGATVTGPPGPRGEPGQAGQDGSDGRDGTAKPGTYRCPDPDQYVYGLTITDDGSVVLDCRPIPLGAL